MMELFLSFLIGLGWTPSSWAAPFPFAFWKTTSTACTGWPCGTLGNLSVLAGTTTLSVGTSYDYENVTVAVGATLQFRYFGGVDSDKPVAFGVHGTLTLNGTIKAVNAAILGGASSASMTAPDGYSFTAYTPTAGIGGDGGTEGGGTGNAVGDVGGAGGGTAGGAGSPDGDGGAGADGSVPIGGTGGAGGTVYGNSGSNGGTATSSVSSTVIGGSGGGGAYGFPGGGLYIKVAGTTSGTGTISVNGQAAGNGGNGGDAINGKISGVRIAYGGGGAGGGGGGGGGKLVARYKTSLPSFTHTAAGGAGGTGGSGGIGVSSGTTANGDPGFDGTAGGSGTTDVATY